MVRYTKKMNNQLREDLAVWFGTKKKKKGTKQPQGPWVNICRKKEGGGHPPCGRGDTDKGAYPKCRAKGVASKMTDAQKKAACQQKRTAEKKDTQSGKGQKPVYTSYKPKKTKKNEAMRAMIKNLLQETINRKQMLELGTLVELEHTKNPTKAKKIAKDHLDQNSKYYCLMFRIGLIDEKDAKKMAKEICPTIQENEEYL